MVNTLLECVTASDVCDSVVNGQILMKDRQVQTLDERKILQNNLLIPEGTMKIILYLVVLLFGISILLRKDKENTGDAKKKRNQVFFLVLGIVTGAICAASGAGGPVLVMPILTLLGIPAHTAVGISLFDSIFIALPAAIGYLHAAAGNKEVFVLLPILLIAYGIGVFAGSKNATKINQKLLKQIVAVASIAIACIKLFL
mgnify:FL=1